MIDLAFLAEFELGEFEPHVEQYDDLGVTEMLLRDNSRTPEARLYRRLYRDKRWARYRNGELVGGLSLEALRRDGFRCQRCTALLGIRPRDYAVHHQEPHKGDPRLFWDIGNLESLCALCHDKHAQADEARGYSIEIGEDGWPTDDRHPANK